MIHNWVSYFSLSSKITNWLFIVLLSNRSLQIFNFQKHFILISGLNFSLGFTIPSESIFFGTPHCEMFINYLGIVILSNDLSGTELHLDFE